MNKRLIIAFCLFTYAFYLLFEYIFTDGKMGVPLDDTWIHFQFAENFTKGFFFQYNPGEPTAGTTSPLYVMVLGAAGIIFNNFLIASIIVSALFHTLSCVLIYNLSLLIFSNLNFKESIVLNRFTAEDFSFLTALITVFSGRFAWASMSGMETTMFTFFCIAGVYFHVKNMSEKKFTLAPAVMLSFAAVSRPEGILLCIIYFSLILLNFIKDKAFKRYYLRLIIAIIIFAIVVFPYLIFSYTISGNFSPNTFRGQGGGFTLIPDFNYLRIAIIYFFRDNFITGALYLVSIIFFFSNIKKFFTEFKYVNLIFVWIIILPIAFSIFIPNWRHHVRYLIPLIPFVNITATYVLIQLIEKNYFRKFSGLIGRRKILFGVLILASLIYYVVYAIALGKNTDNINDQQVKLAYWVKENVKNDETIGINDIGAITFISKNRIIDMAGLVTPEILKYRTYKWNDNLDSTNYLLKKNNVSYIIIYDEWFKEFLDKYKDNFTFVTSAYLEDNTICGGKEMKVYKTNYNSGEN